MAISWGAWDTSGINGMRVGIEVTTTSVSRTSSSVTFTAKIYTENQGTWSDGQTLNYGGSISGTTGYTNSQGSGTVTLRASKTYTYDYGSTEYGDSPGNKTFIATVTGTFNGVTPTKSLTVAIPARPIASPLAVTNTEAEWLSDTQALVTWDRNASYDRPYDILYFSKWDNISNAWTADFGLDFSDTSVTASMLPNRRYQFRVRAKNSAGYSAYDLSHSIQTTPSAPTGLSAVASSPTSVALSWTNNSSTGANYSVTTIIEQSVDGGAWVQVQEAAEGIASAAISGLNPGSVYQFRVAARSTLGVTTTSSYSTSSTVQLLQVPADPTGLTVTYNSDTSTTLAWTDHPDSSAPYDSITVQRWNSADGIWVTVGSLGGTASGLVDTSTIANRRYQWRVRANNLAGSSAWVTSSFIQTTPAAPTSVTAKHVSGGIQLSWVNNVSTGYSPYTIGIRYYENGVLVTSAVTVAAGETSWTLTPINLASTYKFGVRAVSTVGVSKQSAWTDSADIVGATIPNAPVSLSPNASVVDYALSPEFTWAHSPSLDGSDQTKFEIQHRLVGAGSWTSTGQITDTDSEWTLPPGTYTNGQNIEWQVRTWGVHASPSAWSATATVTGSATPVVTINDPSSSSLPTSRLDVSWTYTDGEATAQAAWQVQLYDADNSLLEEQTDNGTATSTTMATVITNGASYTLKVRAQDASGLWSNYDTIALTADFTPPAPSLLSADYNTDSGAVVLTLTPTAAEPGVTLEASTVDIQRRVLNDEGAFEEWETIAKDVAPDAILVDPTAPIAGNGEFRAITYSEAPSSEIGESQVPLAEERWLFVSGGSNFSKVCRMYGNIELKSTASRSRALYHFAGRKKPVLFAGEATEQVIDVAGLLDDESSPPKDWENLAKTADVVLLRDPLGRRIYGSMSQVSLDRLANGLYAIAFTVTEVDYP